MSTTKVEKAATVHGVVEYEAVTCSSCEAEVPKQSAKRFVIGDVEDYHDWSHRGVYEYEFSRETCVKGWACEYCREEDPIQFPAPLPPEVQMVIFGIVMLIGIITGVMIA